MQGNDTAAHDTRPSTAHAPAITDTLIWTCHGGHHGCGGDGASDYPKDQHQHFPYRTPEAAAAFTTARTAFPMLDSLIFAHDGQYDGQYDDAPITIDRWTPAANVGDYRQQSVLYLDSRGIGVWTVHEETENDGCAHFLWPGNQATTATFTLVAPDEALARVTLAVIEAQRKADQPLAKCHHCNHEWRLTTATQRFSGVPGDWVEGQYCSKQCKLPAMTADWEAVSELRRALGPCPCRTPQDDEAHREMMEKIAAFIGCDVSELDDDREMSS